MQSKSTSPLTFELGLSTYKVDEKSKPMHIFAVATADINQKNPVKNSNVPNANFNPNNRKVNFNWNNHDNVNDNARFRSSDEGFCAYKDFLQPPSILPISSICACTWNIFVSLHSLSSSKSLSFSVAVSSFPVAFIR